MSEPFVRPNPTIMVATDFSDTAQAGVRWAAELARSYGASIDLVHALLLPNRATDFAPSEPGITEALWEAAQTRMDATAEGVRGFGIEVAAEVRLGLPSEAVLEAIAERQPDLVVVGTRGHTGLTHLLLGSTAERVVQHSPRPVLTVHPGDIDQHREVETILFTTDFSPESDRALEPALGLLRRRPSGKLILLNVYHLPYEYTVYGTIPTALNFRDDAQGKSEVRLREIAAPLLEEGLDVEPVSRQGFPPEVIVAEAEERDADLIVMGTHGRSGLADLLLGSTARRVVQTAPCPVLTVRRAD